VDEEMPEVAGGPRGGHPHDVILGGVSDLPEVAGGPGGVSDLLAVVGSPPPDVILGEVSDLPEVAWSPSAGDSLVAGDLVLPEEVVDLDLPEEVVNDELDDLFVDVTTASPQKEDRSLAKNALEKEMLSKEMLSCVRGAHRCRYPGHVGAGSRS